MSYVVIPLTSEPDQSFDCVIPVDGRNIALSLRLRFNTSANYWVLTIADPKTKVVILDSIPMLTGDYPAADILGQYTYLRLGSACIVKAGNSSLDYPDDLSLGTDFVLVWGDTVV